jgi:hypothetical protein
MRNLRTILIWTTALLFVAPAGGCHADPASPPDWSSSLVGSWVGHIGFDLYGYWGGPVEGGPSCGQLEAVLNVAPSGEITGTWALPNGYCGGYAGTLRGSLASDFVTLRFTTSTGSNLFLELARRANGSPVDVAAPDEVTGHVFTDTGSGRRLELSGPASLNFVVCDSFWQICVGVPGQGSIVWAAVPSES